MRMRAARFFGATKKGIFALKNYYEHRLPCITALHPEKRPNLAFPHPTHYISLDDRMSHAFKYLSQPDKNKLVFYGITGNEKICIKFVRRYSKEAHMTCSKLGFAPALRGFQEIPGQWYMVVMDYIGDEYHGLDESPLKASFEPAIRSKVSLLHQEGFVHGDIRTTNVMVEKIGVLKVMLLDFDWAGVIGQVTYPMNVNNETVKRPWGAHDGELIKAEHDIAMIDFMF